MVDYKYNFGILRTGQPIGSLPLFGVNMARKLNNASSFTGTTSLDQTGLSNELITSLTVPGYCYVVVERNKVPVWGGLVWAATYQSQAKTLQLNAQSWEVYPYQQLIDTTPFINTDEDQRNIFINLWNRMQGEANRNLAVVVPPTYTSISKLRTVNVQVADNKYYGEIMDEIANGEDGFDWTIETSGVEGVYVKTIRIGWPKLGSLISSDTIIFEYFSNAITGAGGGNITNYYKTLGMNRGATRVLGIGDSVGGTNLTSAYEHSDLYSGGWLRFDKDQAFKGVTDQPNLDSLTVREATKRRAPMATLVATVKGDKEPQFGSYALGDSCILAVRDALHPNGIKLETRIIGWSLTPPSSSNTEEVALEFEGQAQ